MFWCLSEVNRLLETKNYVRLCEKRLCNMDGKQFYLNAFEYCIFSNTDICSRLSVALHTMGFVSSDMLTPFITQQACVKGFYAQYKELASITWSKDVLTGLIKRPDAYSVLKCRNGFSGYEFALSNKDLSQKVGKIMMEENVLFNEVIRYDVFRSARPGHIRAMFNM